MRRLATLLVVLGWMGTAAAAEKVLDGGQVHQGFALELNISSRLFTIAGVGTTISFGALRGGFMAGYKLGRIIFGLGFDLSRVATGSSSPGSDNSQADTAIFFVPGVKVDWGLKVPLPLPIRTLTVLAL